MAILFIQEQNLLPLVQAASSEFNVPVALIFAHMKQESSFNSKAYRAEPSINDTSIGLMQVLLGTARTIIPGITLDQLYDPATNIRIGAAYIAKNLTRYGNIPDAIASYNAGSAYKDANDNYISKSGKPVQPYVDKVLNNYDMYLEWLGKGTPAISVDTDLWVFGGFILIGTILLYVVRKNK